MGDDNKILKEDFIVLMAVRIITERHLKPLTSAQRQELNLDSAAEAKDLQHEAICLFCRSCANNHMNIQDTIKNYVSKTKKQRMEIYRQAQDLLKKKKFIESKLGPNE